MVQNKSDQTAALDIIKLRPEGTELGTKTGNTWTYRPSQHAAKILLSTAPHMAYLRRRLWRHLSAKRLKPDTQQNENGDVLCYLRCACAELDAKAAFG